MRTRLLALLGTAALATTAVQLVPETTAPAEAAGTATLTVGGDAAMYPAFSPTISRYAVRPAADGSVRVDVSGASAVWFDGAPDADGTATFSGLAAGEEISVFLDSGSGPRSYALYVLPEGFPTLEAAATGAPLEPGNIALTLDRFDRGASPSFEAIVDRHGVPVYTRRGFERGLDLKLAGNGRFTVQRPTTTPDRTGMALVELDDQFNEVRRHETVGLVDTDGHDSLLEPDGSRWLLAYEPNPETGLVDSVVQHLDPSGKVVWEWSSADYSGETVTPANADYAHANSLHVQPNGDVLVSFRHFSSVFLIASEAHDGHQPGDVIWKLGGRDSDFAFPAGDVGPCAQHSATILPNGNVLLFDNGSAGGAFGSLCVDQDNPTGPATVRNTSRVVEFELSPLPSGDGKGAATVKRLYGDTDRFAWFMASARQLDNGNVLIGWASAPGSMATETDPTGATVWRLGEVRPETNPPRPFLPYRAALVPARDGFDPEVTLGGPADGLTVMQGSTVPVSFSCTDRGGSTLQTCEGPAGRQLDTAAPGTRTWSVTARDGSGRTTTMIRTYTVIAPPAATPPPAGPAAVDLALRVLPRAGWTGAGVMAPQRQAARARLRPGRVVTAWVRVTNSGETSGRFRLRGPALLAAGTTKVTYAARGRDRTAAVRGHGWRTPVLRPGASLRVTVRVRVRDGVRPGRYVLPVRAMSRSGRDRVGLVLRVR